jgi:lysophospholipase L1-like esterase
MTKNTTNPSRRMFLKSTAAALGGASLFLSGCHSGLSAAGKSNPVIQKGDTVLFQGDSITDAHRDKSKQGHPNDTHALGKGYVSAIAASLLTDRAADELKIYNTGISGNKVYQLAARWDTDCLDVQPDVLSILIGVNDIWHTLNGHYDGTVETYETDYRALLKRTVTALPDVRLVICEPFVLRCGAVNDNWFPAFDGYRAAAGKLSKEFGTLFVPFQSMFDEAATIAPPTHWLGDGVHPTLAGAYAMAQEWLRVVHAG